MTKRKDINPLDTWKLEDIYASDEDWNKDYELLDKLKDDLEKYKGHLMDDANTLLEFLKLDEKISCLSDKLYLYASMRYDEDTTNSFYQSLKGKITNLNAIISEKASFVTPEFISGDYEVIKKYLSELDELKKYDFAFLNIYRFKQHTLSEKEEKILSSLGNVLSNYETIAGIIRNSDLKFGSIIDNGNEVVLNNSSFSKLISSSNQEVRKQTFNQMYDVYGNFTNTLACSLANHVSINNKIAKIRNYDNALSMALFGNNIDVKIYDNLINTISDNLDILYDYYKLKKEVLNLDELHLYDVYAELIGESSKEYSFDEAKDIVINALSVLGKDYIENLNKAFSERWIDKYFNDGKRSGAYAWSGYMTHPYVLLNFDGRLDSVSTLAHELGHAMHYYYSINNNFYQYYNNEIFVAEVASTVNELLVYNYLLNKTNDKQEKLSILNNLMEMFKGTIYRQTMFAEFEKILHDKDLKGEVLTYENINSIYYDLNKKYFGNDVVIDEYIKYEWERVPHFYYNFYVYQYATGMSAACMIVKNILDKKEGFTDKYLSFLKSGSSDYPVNLLKKMGIDMTDSKVLENALEMFKNYISEFRKLYK